MTSVGEAVTLLYAYPIETEGVAERALKPTRYHEDFLFFRVAKP